MDDLTKTEPADRDGAVAFRAAFEAAAVLVLAYLATRTCPFCYSVGLERVLLNLAPLGLLQVGVAVWRERRFRRAPVWTDALIDFASYCVLGLALGLFHILWFGFPFISLGGVLGSAMLQGLFVAMFLHLWRNRVFTERVVAGRLAAELTAEVRRSLVDSAIGILAAVLFLGGLLVARSLVYLTGSSELGLPPAFFLRSFRWFVVDTLVVAGLVGTIGFLALLELRRTLAVLLSAKLRVLEEVEGGNLRVRLSVPGGHEFGRLAYGINQLLEGFEDRARIRAIFGKYLSPDVARRILAQSETALGGTEKQVALLYTDIVGFTAFCENRAPGAVVTRLNQHFAHMVGAIHAQGGAVDKFVGDACLAFFEADVPAAAVTAAWTAAREIRRGGAGQLPCGVAVHLGRVIAGNIGTDERLEYTVIGDAVNTVARMEAATRPLGAPLLISGEALAELPAPHGCRCLGEQTLRGRQQPVELWTLDEPANEAEKA